MSASTALFRYAAQTDDGHTLDGEMTAADHDAAVRTLENAGLRIVNLETAPEAAKRALRGVDFQAFNQQLAHLTRAGLPVDAGLKLIADDLGQGRLAASVRAVAVELDRGASLGEAFDRHRAQFPPQYARLIDAGVGSGKLPAMLLNLGKHLEMNGRLKHAVWQAVAYPLVLLVAVLAVLVFITHSILPVFSEIYDEFDTDMPALTILVLRLADLKWVFVGLLGVVVVAPPLLWVLGRVAGHGASLRDTLLIPIPWLGPAIQRNLLARWCDLVGVGVSAGMDLPAALELARDGVDSPRLRADTERLLVELRSGGELGQVTGLRLLDPSVPASMQLAAEHQDLGAVLEDLAMLYQEHAEMRITGIQSTLAPVLLIGIALLVALMVVALFLPMVRITTSVM